MRKILFYCLGVLGLLNMYGVYAVDKFEILPDLPDSLSYAVQSAQAASVTGSTDISTLGASSVGNEPSIISVVLSLLFVILLIYLTGIIYSRLNKVNLKNFKQANSGRLQASVVSTTQLGNNKTLHVVELDGKRMLIGASTNAIQLIKDLGSINKDFSDDEYSHIEIPNIKIPKIEIPKIEIPSINFSKLATKIHKPIKDIDVGMQENTEEKQESSVKNENVEIEDDTSEVIIDSLFPNEDNQFSEVDDNVELGLKSEHTVNPEDFALYKKYL